MIISTLNFRSGLPDLPGWRLVLLEVLQKEKSRGGEKEEEKEISSGSWGEYKDIISSVYTWICWHEFDSTMHFCYIE